MNRKLRPARSPYQLKDEQMNFLLEDIEKNLEEYKKIVETKNKQLAEVKRILQGAKNSYKDLTKENKQLKECIVKIKQQFKQQQQQQQPQYFQQKQEYFKRKNIKKLSMKRLVIVNQELKKSTPSQKKL